VTDLRLPYSWYLTALAALTVVAVLRRLPPDWVPEHESV
jgi:hypothetical protein